MDNKITECLRDCPGGMRVTVDLEAPKYIFSVGLTFSETAHICAEEAGIRPGG